MSQDAYALFQTIKTIKGHTMIHTHTLTANKTLQSNYHLLSTPNNMLATGYSAGTDIHSIIQTLPTTNAFSKIFTIGPAPIIKLIVMMAGGLNINIIRVTGWTKADNGYQVPQILWSGPITTLGTYASPVGYSSLLPVVTFGISTAGYTTSAITNTMPHYQMLGSGAITPGALVLNTLGNQLIEIEMLGATAQYTAVENVPINITTNGGSAFTFAAGALTGIPATGSAIISTIRVATGSASIGAATHVASWSGTGGVLGGTTTGTVAGACVVSVGPVWNAFIAEF